MAMGKRGKMILGGLAMGLVLLLAACYLPNHFKSEIRLGRTGDFGFSYYGELTWAPLWREAHKGTLKPEELALQINELKTDLARDKGFKQIDSLGQGVFKVAYEREGHMQASDLVTFVRRNAIVIQITAKPDGRVIVSGNSLKPSDAQTATSMGLDVQGQFRIITDGLVKEHNATSIQNFNGYRVYIWDIQNAFSPAPRFVMQRDGVWTPEPPGKDKRKP
jgi:hypothetical protein